MAIISEKFDMLGRDNAQIKYRLGIMGGTFDPIHIGHLVCAEQARDALDLDGVIFIPTGLPVFKRDQDIAESLHRFAMCQLAIADNPYFDVSPLEINREGNTYSVDTLQSLRDFFPENVKLYFIAGADALTTITSWKDAKRLATLAHFVGLNRPHNPNLQNRAISKHLDELGFRASFVQAPLFELSSSDIRLRVSQGRSVRYLLPASVADYIEAHGLYRNYRQDFQMQGSMTAQQDTVFHIETALPSQENRVSSEKQEKSHALAAFAYQPTEIHKVVSSENPLSKENYKTLKKLLKQRLTKSRYEHSLAVAKTAKKMAKAYGVDPDKARMAGLLHDWDKALTPTYLKKRVEDYQLPIDSEVVDFMPWLLHGQTAAAVLGDEFPELGDEVLDAIGHHTTGAVPMSDLDMIIFSADKLEPTRDIKVYRDLYDQIGRLDLVDIFTAVLQEGLRHLVESGRPLEKTAVNVWNYYL